MFGSTSNPLQGTEAVRGGYDETTPTAKLLPDGTHLESALLPPSEAAPAHSRCRDAGWAALFVAQLVAVIAVAASVGVPQIQTATEGVDVSVDVPVKKAVIELWFGTLLGLAFTGMCLSWAWLKVMLAHPQSLITGTFYMVLGLKAVGMLVCLYYGLLYPAVGIGICLAFFLCYWRAWASRIPFAAANLELACLAIKQYYGVVYTAMFKQLATVVWGATWLCALVGLYLSMTDVVDCPSTTDPVTGAEVPPPDDATCFETDKQFNQYAALLSFSLVWTKVTLMYVVHATAASNVGTWWFTPYQENVDRKSVV